MTKIHTDYDAFTGVKTTFAIEDDKLKVNYQQNVEPIYDRLRKLREEDQYKKNGIKQGFMHAVSIAPVDGMKMIAEHGFDPWASTADEILSFCRKNKDKFGHCFAAKGNV